MSSGINLARSFSGYALKTVLAELVPGEDQGIKKYAKLATCSVAFALGTVALLVEGIARAALGIVAKLFTFFIPKQWAETIDNGVSFLATTSVGNIKNAMMAGYMVVGVLIPNFENIIVTNRIKALFEHATVVNAVKIFSTIHFNGFSDSEAAQTPLELKRKRLSMSFF